jgi:prolyl-tRNA synthetase
MTHSDDDGLVLPPRLAPSHVVIIPIVHQEETRSTVLEYCERLAREIADQPYDGRPIRVEVDLREGRGGDKVWTWVRKGVPVRLEIGPRDIESDSVFVGRRDRGPKDRYSQPRAEFVSGAGKLLQEIQKSLYDRALAYREEHTRRIDSKEEFYDFFTPEDREKPEIHGGFALCHWSGDSTVEQQVGDDLNVTIRCIPFDTPEEEGHCVISGKPSRRRVVFAKAY